MNPGTIEVGLAALVPAAVALALARKLGDGATWRAMARWFVPIVLVWLAPCWLTGRSPVAFGFLHTSVPPWTADSSDEPGGTPQLNDVPMQFAPWRETVTRRWRGGELPWLDRYAGSGSALWANPQALVIHPLTLAGLPFSTFAWFVFVASAKLVAGLAGMFVFLRREGISERASVFGSIAYALSAFSIAWLLFPHTNVTMLLPWLLVAIREVVSRASSRAAAGGALVLALMCMGGHPESVVHCAFVALPYAAALLLGRSAGERPRALLRLGAIGIVGILLAAPLLVPFAIALPESERMARWERMPRFWTAPPLTPENVFPFVNATVSLYGPKRLDFSETGTQYVGLLALALALWRAGNAARKERLWLGIFGASAMLAFDWPPSRWLEPVPLVKHMLNGRLRFVLAFVVAMLAAKAIDDVVASTARRGVLAWIAVCAAASIASVSMAWREIAAGGLVVAAVASTGVPLLSAVEAMLLLNRNDERFRAVAPILLAADLAASLWFFNAPVSRRIAYPPTPGLDAIATRHGPARIAGISNALLPNSAAMFHLEEIGVHDPMAWNPYVDLLRRAGYDTSEYFARWRQVPPKLLLDYLGVTALVAPAGIRIAGLDVAYAGRDLTVYRNNSAMMRVFVPSSVVAARDPLMAFTRSAGASAVAIASGHAARLSPARLRIERYDGNGEVVHVECESETFVATSEVAIPGWRLDRDGDRWPLVRVNGVFLGWRVPPAGGRFTLRYRPPGIEAGAVLAMVGLLGLAALLVSDRRIGTVPYFTAPPVNPSMNLSRKTL